MANPASAPDATIAEVGEFGLIEIIRGMVPAGDRQLVLGIGDDCAAFRPTPGTLTLATCDIQVEGRHFRRDRISAHQLGRRSAAINLSDIGAMGGRPRYALISLALPADTRISWVRDLYAGLGQEMARFKAGIIGGNLSGSEQSVVIDITLLGEVPEGRMVRRRGARPGDAVLLTGTLGLSAAGLLALERGLDPRIGKVEAAITAHLTPTPRVREGMAAGASGLATAMIDVSDGLASDLGHICGASKAGARIFAEKLPIAAETGEVAAMLGADPLTLALHGGEDYELVLTCRAGQAAALIRAVGERMGTLVTQIGEIIEGSGLTLRRADGTEEPLTRRGWDHFRT